MNHDAVAANGEGTAERIRALLRLAVRASGAGGGVLQPDDASIATVRVGITAGRRDALRLSDGRGKSLATLALFDADDVGGVEEIVTPILEQVLGCGVECVMHDRVAELERELAHRTGNLLQGVASFMRMQADDSDLLTDGSGDQARALIEEARLRVMVVGAIHSSLERGVQPDGSIETSLSLQQFCERLADILPGPVTFSNDLAELALPRDHVVALGTMMAEFAIAAMRDVFPKPTSNSVHLRTSVHHEGGIEHIAMILHHAGEGYDTRGWAHGSPRFAGRVVETLARHVDGLVAIDRSDKDDDKIDACESGLRLRLVFDRPIARTVRGAESDIDAEGARLSDTPRTFDNRLGVQTGHAVMRKS